MIDVIGLFCFTVYQHYAGYFMLNSVVMTKDISTEIGSVRSKVKRWPVFTFAVGILKGRRSSVIN